ncbi:MAG TPA: hypothetical protein DIU15_09645, partial [Deltaproteobacteria bacterium]|nr:hypothetical protein [Deltaproteobacteria bacterium]
MLPRLSRVLGAWRDGAEIPPEAFRAAILVTVPVAALGLSLKIHRIALHPSEPGLISGSLLLGGEVLVYLGFGLLVLGGLTLAGRLRAPRLGLVAAQVSAVVLTCLGFATHNYYLSTGFTLNYSFVRFALVRLDETGAVVASELKPFLVAIWIGVTLLVLALPWIFRKGSDALVPGRVGGRAAGIALVHIALGTALVGASLLPSGPNVGREFFREPTVAMVASAFQTHSNQARVRDQKTRLVGPSEVVPRPDAGSLNLVMFILESTRAQGTTPYNPELGTTPVLDQLAKESLFVERAYAVVPHTSKALVALLCGFEPAPTVEIVESHETGMVGRCLADLLRDHGYTTAYFQAPKQNVERRPDLVENMGFDRFWSGDMSKQEGINRINYFGKEDAVMLEPTRKWLANEAKEPFFAAYLNSNTHHPYNSPPGFELQEFSEKKKLNKYFNSIASADQFLEQLITLYRDAGLWDRTVFIVVGDHGEAFKEHGLSTHDNVMYEEVLAVPLLARVPGREAERIPGPVNQLAVAPTALDLLGYDFPDGAYEGASILERPKEPELFATCYRSEYCSAMINGDKKLIYHFGDRPPLLFDIAKDPLETQDLAELHPTEVAQWAKQTEDWKLSLWETYRTSSQPMVDRYVRDTPQPVQHELEAVFGDLFELRGYKLPKSKVMKNRRFKVHYFFKVLKPIPPGYRLLIYTSTTREKDRR